MALKAGDWVEVRAKEEILKSLDKDGRLEGLPFMPEMFRHCGETFRVYKRAHKTCDPTYATGGRQLPHGIHLDIRCDGQAHGGCQAGCLIFWKEAWLKPVGDDIEEDTPPKYAASASPADLTPAAGCTVKDVCKATRIDDGRSNDPIYSCQATRLLEFTKPLAWWDVRQYVEDYTSGNASPGRLLRGFLYLAYYHGTQSWRNKIGRPSRWFYDFFQSLWGGLPYPRRRGFLPKGKTAPTVDLNLQPGEWVRVKPHKEILATVDIHNMNRGLRFDGELVPYCGKVYRVHSRVQNFIDEKTGRMTTLKTPAVILERVWCRSRYSNCRMFCPRSIYSWWREIWLEKVDQPSSHAQTRSHANAQGL